MKQNPSPAPAGRRFFRPRDIFIIAAVLAAALVLWLVLRGGAQSGEVAVVTIGTGTAQATREIPLGGEGLVEIDGALPVHLEVAEGAIRFVDSVCPDHDCEGFGWLRHEGDWGACLPAEVAVQIKTAG